jgi:hypothetical protein
MSSAGTVKPGTAICPARQSLRVQQAFKTALSLALLYWLALSMNWDMPKYGALAIVLISLDTTGASLQKGVMRMIGTTVGLVVGLLGLALFAQDGLAHPAVPGFLSGHRYRLLHAGQPVPLRLVCGRVPAATRVGDNLRKG